MSITEQEYLERLYKANEKIQKLVEALNFYADESRYQKECVDSRTGTVEEVVLDNGRIARNTLEECGL